LQLAGAYRKRAEELNASPTVLEAIDQYFSGIDHAIRRVETDRLAAEPKQLAALLEFASRACRRPLTDAEQAEWLAEYRTLRERDGLAHEEAVRDVVVNILTSPRFGFLARSSLPGAGPHPLTPWELASRLSYFLWSTMPDDELLDAARTGALSRPEVLAGQARRMLRDARSRHLAIEFLGNWLEFRRFEEHNAVDRERFPTFTPELREAMFEEPVRFFVDLAQRNGSILECLHGRQTFVNGVLARHYEMPAIAESAGDWVRVDDARPYGRGGLLPMAVFLTKNSPGLRTSPVKRGYWVVRRLLGEHIPPPPPEVPELPKDESKLGDLTLPQVLARHRDHKACAGCHQRFDSFGLAFEGFGPVGERRTLDLGGRPIQASAVYPDEHERTGLEGLLQYVGERRQDDFVDNFCRKLMTYALGRSLLPSDRPTVEEIKRKLAADEYRIGTLIEAIVTSPQFLLKRGADDPRNEQ
jgi:hypothetical protein